MFTLSGPETGGCSRPLFLCSRVGDVLDGELQEWPEVSGREDDGTSEVRDVQLAVPETGNGCGQTEGHGRAGVRQQRQDLPFVVSYVHGRVRHRRCDRNQVVGPVRRLSGRNCGGYVGVDFVRSGRRKRLAKSWFKRGKREKTHSKFYPKTCRNRRNTPYRRRFFLSRSSPGVESGNMTKQFSNFGVVYRTPEYKHEYTERKRVETCFDNVFIFRNYEYIRNYTSYKLYIFQNRYTNERHRSPTLPIVYRTRC